MTQLSIMIALLAALALGNAIRSPVQQSHSGDSISLDKVNTAEPPHPQAGGGEGGWPGF